ncbi:MAG: response regulator [bacterium]
MSKGRVLVIEDEAIVADDMVYCLEEAGYSVTAIASSGEEALRHAESGELDLALVDILLGGTMDGIETAGALRQSLGIPVVYVTSFTNEPMIERAKQTRPSGYIVKPFKRRELLATVEMALHQAPSRSGLSITPPIQHGRLLARWWSEALIGLPQERSEEALQLSTSIANGVSRLLQLKPDEEIPLEVLLPPLRHLFSQKHPAVSLSIHQEPEARTVRAAPFVLFELLGWMLMQCAKHVEFGELRLEAGVLQTTDENASFLNLRPGVYSRFRVLLPAPSESLATSLDHPESMLLLNHFRAVALQLAGELVLLQNGTGLSGIAVALLHGGR